MNWRRLARRTARVGLRAALLAAILHLPSVQAEAWAGRIVSRVASTLGLDVRVDCVSYNLFTLAFNLKGLRLSSPARPDQPVLTAGLVRVDVAWASALYGLRLDSIEVHQAVLRVVGATGGQPAAGPLVLPTANIGRVVLDDVRLAGAFGGEDGKRDAVDLPGLSGTLASNRQGGLTGTVSAAAGGTVRAGPVTINLTELRTTAVVRPREVTIKAFRARFPGGQTLVSGRVPLGPGDSRLNLDIDGRFDVGILTRALPAPWHTTGQLHVSGRLSGTLADPQLAVDVSDATLTHQRVGAVVVAGRAEVSGERLHVTGVDARVFGGRVTGEARIALGGGNRDDGVTFAWHGVDVARVLASLGWTGSPRIGATLDGQASIDGHLLSPASWSVTAGSRFARTAAPAALPVDGRIQLTSADRRWSLDVIEAATGGLRLSGRLSGALGPEGLAALAASSVGGRLDVDVDSLDAVTAAARKAGLNVPVVVGVEGRVTATAQVEGMLEAPKVHARLDAPALRVGGFGPLRTRGEARWADGRLSIESLVAQHEGGELQVAGSITPASGAIAATFRLAVGEAGDILPLISTSLEGIRGRATAEGRIDGSVRDPHLEADVSVEGAAAPGLAIGSVTGHVVATQQLVHVEAAVPRLGGSVDATVEPLMPYRFDAVVDLAQTDLHELLAAAAVAPQLSGVLVGTADARLTLSGSLDAAGHVGARLDLKTLSGSLASVPLRLAGPATVSLDTAGWNASDVELWLGPSTLRVDGRLPRQGEGSATVTLDSRLSGIPPILAQLGNIDAAAEGTLRVQLTATGRLDAVRLSGRLALDAATLTAPGLPALQDVVLDASLADGTIDIRSLRASSGDARLEARGRVPMGLWKSALPDMIGRLLPAPVPGASITAHATSLTPSLLTAWLGADMTRTVGGIADVSVTIEAGGPSLQDLRAEIVADRATVTLDEVPLTQASPGRARIERGDLHLGEWRWTGSGTDLVMAGTVGRIFEAPTLDLRASGILDLRLAGALLPGRTAGTIRTDLRIGGTPGDPSVDGELRVADAGWLIRSQQIALSGLSGVIRLSDNRATFDQLAGHLNGGSVTLGGQVQPSTGPDAGGLTLRARDVAVDRPAGLRSWLDGDLSLSLAGGSPRLSGKVTVRPGILRSSLLELSGLADESQPGVSAAGSGPSLLDRVALDVEVSSSQDLVALSSELNLQVVGSLRFTGTLGRPGLVGRVTIRQGGEIYFGGRTYRVDDGRVDFVSPASIAPKLAITAETRAGEYHVTMRVSGSPDRLGLVLTSDPPLAQSDLSLLLTTGRAAGRSTPGQAGQIGQRAQDDTRERMLAAMSSGFLGNIGRTIGLDTVRVESDGFDYLTDAVRPVARLKASKEFGHGFAVTYSQGLSEVGDYVWIASWRPEWKQVELRAAFRSDGGKAIEIRQDLALGGAPRATTARPPRPKPPPAPIVERVDVSGVDPGAQQELIDGLSLRPGSHFTAMAWQEDQESLARSFHERDHLDVRVSATRQDAGTGDRLILSYAIEAGPITRLRVAGYAPSSATLRELEEAWADSVVDDFRIDAVTRVVRLDLVGRGYARPSVDVRIASLPDPGARSVEVAVRPGPHADLRRIEFRGNDHVPSARLADAVSRRRLDPACWVQADDLITAVRNIYLAAGYLDVAASVGPPEITRSVAVLPVTVNEGRLFTIAGVSVDGGSGLPAADVRKALGLSPGTPYVPPVVLDRVATLEREYRARGFDEVVIDLRDSVDRPSATVALTLAIAEGPRHVLAGVSVEGQLATTRSWIDRLIALAPGAPADPVALERAQRDLYATGSFRSVQVDTRPDGAAGSVDGVPTQSVRAVFTVEESPLWQLRYGVRLGQSPVTSLGTAASNATLLGTFDVTRRHLFGTGLSSGVGVVSDGSDFRVRGTVSAPTFLGRFATTTIALQQERQHVTAGDTAVVLRATTAFGEQRWRRGRQEFAYRVRARSRQRRVPRQRRPRRRPGAATGERQLRGRNRGLDVRHARQRVRPARGHVSFVAGPGGETLAGLIAGLHALPGAAVPTSGGRARSSSRRPPGSVCSGCLGRTNSTVWCWRSAPGAGPRFAAFRRMPSRRRTSTVSPSAARACSC